MKYQYHVIVIGGGSAGLIVASGCAGLGAKVALIEKDKMGGDCLNVGCVPSKTFLRSAHIADYIKKSSEFGLDVFHNNIDIKKVLKRVNAVIESIAPHDSKERYESMGVEVFLEEAILKDNHTVRIGNKTISGKYIVIATGSEPMVPSIPGLKDLPYFTNKNIFSIERLPEHLMVLGGGPIGLELGQGFRYLGSRVSIIDKLPSIFPKDDPEVAPIMEKKFREDGINLMLNSKILEVSKKDNNINITIERNGKKETINGDHVLVALGRVPSISGLELENLRVKTDEKGYIKTNDYLQTNIKNVYACGDVVGPFQFTHMAGYQGEIVVKNIISPVSVKVKYSAVPWATYTKPEVAHVGYTEPAAKAKGLYKDAVKINLKEMDRARTEGEKIGFLKLILDKKNKVIGATMIGEKASEIISLAAIAIKKKMNATAFAGLIWPYPTESEIFKFASYELYKKSFKPWMKEIVKKIFFR